MAMSPVEFIEKNVKQELINLGYSAAVAQGGGICRGRFLQEAPVSQAGFDVR